MLYFDKTKYFDIYLEKELWHVHVNQTTELKNRFPR